MADEEHRESFRDRQVSDLKTDVAVVKTQVNDIKDDVKDIRKSVDGIKQETAQAIKEAVNAVRVEAKEDISGLERKVTWVQITMVGLLASVTGAAVLVAFDIITHRVG